MQSKFAQKTPSKKPKRRRLRKRKRRRRKKSNRSATKNSDKRMIVKRDFLANCRVWEATLKKQPRNQVSSSKPPNTSNRKPIANLQATRTPRRLRKNQRRPRRRKKNKRIQRRSGSHVSRRSLTVSRCLMMELRVKILQKLLRRNQSLSKKQLPLQSMSLPNRQSMNRFKPRKKSMPALNRR